MRRDTGVQYKIQVAGIAPCTRTGCRMGRFRVRFRFRFPQYLGPIFGSDADW